MVRQVRPVFFSGLLLATACAYAQGPGQGNCPPPGSGPGPGAQMGFPDGGGPHGHGPPPGGPGGGFPRLDGTSSIMRGGLQLGPPGRWWDDLMFAKDLGISPEQTTKMDNIFNTRKAEIFGAYNSLLNEESALERKRSTRMRPVFFLQLIASLLPARHSKKQMPVCCWQFGGKWTTSRSSDWRAIALVLGVDRPGLEISGEPRVW
jgi:hypothetical protein